MAKKKNTNPKLEKITPIRGRVIRNLGSSYLVRLDESGQTVSCKAKGTFRIQGIRSTNPIAVGDMVEITLRDADDTQYITSILPRKNYIIRRASNLSKESHILASNLDQAIIVISIKDPDTPLTFVDRFLATAEAYNVPAAIIINKADIWDTDDAQLAEAIANLYRSLRYPTIIVSAVDGRGIEELKELTKDKISLMAGNSGVGKSSLINVLAPEANLRTGAVSDMHHTGMHTTTFSQMVDLPYGGELIDIPGVKGFGVIDFEPEEVSHFFPEIFEYGLKCKYSDCKHTGDPGCAVVPAVEDHYIAESRYQSYLSILEETMEADGDDKYRKPF